MSFLIKEIQVVNEGKTFVSDVYLKDNIIVKVGKNIVVNEKVEEIKAYITLQIFLKYF